MESAIQNLKNGQLHTQSSTTQANTVQPKNKSPPRSPNAPKMRLASADIEGLIDEYRAPDQVRGPETLQSVITKEVPPRPASAVERATAATGSKLSGAVRRTILTDELSKPQSGSPRSSESGEIRSDQDPGHNLTRNHQTPSATQAAKTESQHGPSVTGVLMKPNPPLGSQSKKDRTNASKSKSKPSAAGPSVRSQDPDRRQSVQPRNEPVPQRIDHSRKVTDHSPSVQVSSVSDVQPSPYRSGCDERFPRKSSVSSTPARPARSQPFPEVDTEVGKSVPGDGAKGMEEGAALSKQQSTKTHRLSSQSQAVSAARGSPPRTDAQVPGSLKPANTTMPSETNVPASQRHASLTVPSAALASQDATDAILSLSQHEQIHRLGLDLSPEGLRDLSDFLEYHGFFVKEYRDGFLARKRRLRWLEQEKLALERESLMQYERFNSIRAQTLAAREQTEPPALAGLQSKEEPGEAAAAKRMPPPLSVQRSTNNRVSATMNEGNNTLEVTPTKAITTRTSPIRTNEYLTSRSALNGSNHKRQHSDDDRDQDRGRKFTRVDSNLQYHNSSQPVSPRTARFGSQLLDGRRPLVYRAADYGYRGPSQSPDSRRRSPSPQRRAPDQFYQSQPNSWTVPYSRGPDRPRPGVEEFRRDSKATFDDRGSRDRSTYPSRSTRGISTADNRGGSRGGRAGKQLWRDYTDYQSSPARQGTVVPNGSEFLNLKAGGQSRSPSLSADLP